ncbi:hypothetical protein STRCR_0907 [Streptococcus criceti HS-6]|uniref:Uncharacterized protein n=1 Tax=Streptococcus criceti HS-6 TaxID=873449 RepID=G5JSC9_STRCG|nr:hypothetical protein STRCR_0907 [Streptococcus criceti HS-6]
MLNIENDSFFTSHGFTFLFYLNVSLSQKRNSINYERNLLICFLF